MLLDTASLYYRAFYGMPETVTAPDGPSPTVLSRRRLAWSCRSR
jgi:hypothetical protein